MHQMGSYVNRFKMIPILAVFFVLLGLLPVNASFGEVRSTTIQEANNLQRVQASSYIYENNIHYCLIYQLDSVPDIQHYSSDLSLVVQNASQPQANTFPLALIDFGITHSVPGCLFYLLTSYHYRFFLGYELQDGGSSFEATAMGSAATATNSINPVFIRNVNGVESIYPNQEAYNFQAVETAYLPDVNKIFWAAKNNSGFVFGTVNEDGNLEILRAGGNGLILDIAVAACNESRWAVCFNYADQTLGVQCHFNPVDDSLQLVNALPLSLSMSFLDNDGVYLSIVTSNGSNHRILILNYNTRAVEDYYDIPISIGSTIVHHHSINNVISIIFQQGADLVLNLVMWNETEVTIPGPISPFSMPFNARSPSVNTTITVPTGSVITPNNQSDSLGVDPVAIGVGVTIPVVVAAVGVFLLVFFLRKKKKNKSGGSVVMNPVSAADIDKRLQIPYKSLEFGRSIGSGSYGVVYYGEWRGAKVAIKVNNQITDTEGFLAEARLTLNIAPHPNLVQTFGVSLDGPNPCIVLEYCGGGSLDKLLYDTDQAMSVEQQRDLVMKIAYGLLHLHNNNVVHRDLAARNILLTNDGQPKISDFGMSRVVELQASLGQTKTSFGPIRWMAPESIRDKSYSTKSDIWSFGIVVNEIVSRQEPHVNEDQLSIAVKIRDHAAIPEIDPKGDPVLIELIKMCLKSDPNDRPTMEQICEFLRAKNK